MNGSWDVVNSWYTWLLLGNYMIPKKSTLIERFTVCIYYLNSIIVNKRLINFSFGSYYY